MKRDFFSLRQTVDMTGVSEFTLRGWELRYGAFSPQRTETGRRRYAAKDLKKAILLRELLNRDLRIGEIAGLSLTKLHALMTAFESGMLGEISPANNEIQNILKHAALQDWPRLEVAIHSAIKKHRPSRLIEKFILPLLEAIGQEVAANRLGIAQEHVLSALLKQTLHRVVQSNTSFTGPKFVVAAPEGDFHELGILAAHAMATQFKINSLYLGPNTPKRQLCETVSRIPATHILLGSTVTKNEGARDDFYSFVHYLNQNVPKQVAFWLGGRGCQPVNLKRSTLAFSSLVEFREQLEKIGKSGKKHA